jgi:PAS domain S-box-containing protein
MAMIVHDLTGEKRAERRFEALLEFAPDAIVGVRRDGEIVLANRQCELLFGYSRGELLGGTAQALIPQRLQRADEGRREGFFHDPESRVMGADAPVILRRKDGAEFAAEVSVSSLEIDGETVAVAAIRDITQRAASQRELALVEELNQSRRLESVGQLAGGIAHDFNNLLGIIINYAKFVSEELPPESQARQDIDEVGKAARRGAALTRQLLIFSRRDVVTREVLDLNLLVAGLENLLRRALGERVALEFGAGTDLWTIEADRGQLEQVLVNLAVNGRDAMPHGGRLVVETCNATLDASSVGIHAGLTAGDYVRLTVSDSGVGMDPEVVRRAFEPFFTTKPKGEGTGLGLATVYGIVADAGGHVSIYSEMGVGTSIKIHLPASTAGVGPRPRSTGRAPRGRGETVLVVEDEIEVRRMSERILTAAGYVVLAAESTDDALRIATSSSVDLVLTDVIMPGLTGPELAENMRVTRPGLKVLFMSGYSHKMLSPEALESEARSGFIEKPFTGEDLERKVRELMDTDTTENK